MPLAGTRFVNSVTRLLSGAISTSWSVETSGCSSATVTVKLLITSALVSPARLAALIVTGKVVTDGMSSPAAGTVASAMNPPLAIEKLRIDPAVALAKPPSGAVMS